jgi:hypothetical protein
MTAKFYILAALLVISRIASAKKMELPIELVAMQATIIATGEIVATGKTTYDFKVAEYIKGHNDQVITIRQFEQWTCDIRYAPVAKGQQLVLFLLLQNNTFTIINGSTGEIPIINNQVVLQSEQLMYAPGKYHPYTLERAEFENGIKKLIRCFSMQNQGNKWVADILVQKCSDAEISTFRSTSKFTAWICNRISERYKIIKANTVPVVIYKAIYRYRLYGNSNSGI